MLKIFQVLQFYCLVKTSGTIQKRRFPKSDFETKYLQKRIESEVPTKEKKF